MASLTKTEASCISYRTIVLPYTYSIRIIIDGSSSSPILEDGGDDNTLSNIDDVNNGGNDNTLGLVSGVQNPN